MGSVVRNTLCAFSSILIATPVFIGLEMDYLPFRKNNV